MAKQLLDLSDLAHAGSTLQIRVTPKASQNRIERSDGRLRVYVTTVPEGGKANVAVLKMLANALGVPKSQLEIVKGDTGRDKVVKIL